MRRLALMSCVCVLLLAPATGWSQGDEELDAIDYSADEPAKVPAPRPAPRAEPEAEQTAAERVSGRVGLGFHSTEAPLGVRYWLSDLVAFDFGFGMWLDERDNPVSSKADDTHVTCDFAFDLGAPIALTSYPNLILFARPGLQIVREYDIGERKNGDAKHDDDVKLELSAQLGAEIFLGALGFPNVSFQGGVGVAFAWFWPEDEEGDSDPNFSMESIKSDLGIVVNARLGFHIYF